MTSSALKVSCIFLLLFSTAASITFRKGIDGRIIGGFEANIRTYPFSAAVTVQTPTSRHFCGGALYETEWVITAAQCTDGATLFDISMGSASLEDEDENRLKVATSVYFMHPDYDPMTLQNDIAIIKFRMPITHTDFIKPIGQLPLTESQNVPLGIQMFAIGWGQTSDSNSSLSNKLQVAYIGPLSNEECRITYGNQLTDNMVCIAGNFFEGICHGDTGSPLIMTLRTQRTVLVGVASFLSINGCETPDPSGYTRTWPYVGWIEDITEVVNVTQT